MKPTKIVAPPRVGASQTRDISGTYLNNGQEHHLSAFNHHPLDRRHAQRPSTLTQARDWTWTKSITPSVNHAPEIRCTALTEAPPASRSISVGANIIKVEVEAEDASTNGRTTATPVSNAGQLGRLLRALRERHCWHADADIDRRGRQAAPTSRSPNRRSPRAPRPTRRPSSIANN